MNLYEMDTYKVDGWNNFCRIFETPLRYSSEFCFGGGIPTNFVMIDWFNPVQGLCNPIISKEKWKEKYKEIETKIVSTESLKKELVPWLRKKSYVKEGREYLVICNFGAAFIFTKCEEEVSNE